MNKRANYVCASINCLPVPKGRPRVTKRGISYTPKRTADGAKEQALLLAPFSPCEPFVGPVAVGLTYTLPLPQRGREPGPHDGPGDVDNFAKLTLDVLTRLQWFRDDRQVSELHAVKRWGRVPGVKVEVWGAV